MFDRVLNTPLSDFKVSSKQSKKHFQVSKENNRATRETGSKFLAKTLVSSFLTSDKFYTFLAPFQHPNRCSKLTIKTLVY